MAKISLDLDDHFDKALRQSCFPRTETRDFASKTALKAITEPSIVKYLEREGPNLDQELVNFIHAEAQEIFAICICADISSLREVMRLFKEHRINDKSLPLSKTTTRKIWSKDRQGRTFRNHQHIFRAQDFPMKDSFTVMPDLQDTILPILRAERIKSEGQFGIVHKVTIHKEYLDSNDPIVNI